MAGLMAADLTREAYRATLARLWGFYAPLEAALAPFAEALPPALRPTPRAARLAADLSFWGVESYAMPLAPPAALPPLTHPADAVGTIYVLEGASLGGRLIARHVRATLGVEGPDGLSFHAGGASRPWPRFRAALDAWPSDDAQADAVVAAADRMFTSLSDWL